MDPISFVSAPVKNIIELDWPTFWVAIGALGSILAALATLAVILYTRNERIQKQSEKKNNILSSLSLELFANYESLLNSHMAEVKLSTISYKNFIENSSLFDIKNNNDLYLALDMLYKNFIYYNHSWEKGKSGYFLFEIRGRIFLYYANLFEKVQNIDQIIQDLSTMIIFNINSQDNPKVVTNSGFNTIEAKSSFMEWSKKFNKIFYTNDHLKSKVDYLNVDDFFIAGYPGEAIPTFFDRFISALIESFSSVIREDYIKETLSLNRIETLIVKFRTKS